MSRMTDLVAAAAFVRASINALGAAPSVVAQHAQCEQYAAELHALGVPSDVAGAVASIDTNRVVYWAVVNGTGLSVEYRDEIADELAAHTTLTLYQARQRVRGVRAFRPRGEGR